MNCSTIFGGSSLPFTEQVVFRPCGGRISEVAWGILQKSNFASCPVCSSTGCAKEEAEVSHVRRHFASAGCQVTDWGFEFCAPGNFCPLLKVAYEENSQTITLFSTQDFFIDVLRNEAALADVLPQSVYKYYNHGHTSGLVMASKDSVKLLKWLLKNRFINDALREKLSVFGRGTKDYSAEETPLFGGKVRLFSSEGRKIFSYGGEAIGEMRAGSPITIQSENALFIAALNYEAKAAGVWPETARKCYATAGGKNLACLVIPQEEASPFLGWLERHLRLS